MLGLLGAIWGRFATIIVGISGVFAMLAGWRFSIRKAQREQIENEQTKRTLERLRIKEKARAEAGAMDDDSILAKLRELGYVRD